MSDLLDNLTPDQREKIEAELAASVAAAGKKLPPWAWLVMTIFLAGGTSVVTIGEKACNVLFGMIPPGEMSTELTGDGCTCETVAGIAKAYQQCVEKCGAP